MKAIFTTSILLTCFCSTVYADPVVTYREFSFRSEAEKQAAEKKALKTIEDTYYLLPDVRNCRAGTQLSGEKRKVLKELNAIRRAHNLEEVGYDESKDRYTAASALISAANKKLDHYPTSRMKCFTQDGYLGSSEGNLSLKFGQIFFVPDNFAEYVVSSLLIDDNVPSLGHRFWFLDPFLGDISYGRSTDTRKDYVDAATVYVGNRKESIPNTKANYIAYPFGNYKSRWFMHDWYSSFSVIVDKKNFSRNLGAVDYSRAQIRVTNSNGNSMPIKNITYTNPASRSFSGLGNSIQWQIIGTKDNERYYVQIKNVIVNGKVTDYDYWFQIQ